MPRIIKVVDHDTTWAIAFEQEAAALAGVFGHHLRRIHHIGSTSVPGLFAKPIIDILIVLSETLTINDFNAAMEALGYRPRGECLDATVPGTPGRFYFSKDRDGTRTHQVHVCAEGHPEISDKIAFRDYLRAHPLKAATYGEIKRKLALAHRADNIGYMLGKDEFVKSLLAEARLWYVSNNLVGKKIDSNQSGMAGLVIRAGEIQDAPRLHDLHTASVRVLCAGHYSEEIIEGWLLNRSPTGYLRPIKRGALFVAEQHGQIIGFGEAAPGKVIAVYVDPTHIRRGVGSAILQKAMSMARTDHDGPIRLEATLNARDFYEHAGFRDVGRSTVRRNHVDLPIVVMEHD